MQYPRIFMFSVNPARLSLPCAAQSPVSRFAFLNINLLNNNMLSLYSDIFFQMENAANIYFVKRILLQSSSVVFGFYCSAHPKF